MVKNKKRYEIRLIDEDTGIMVVTPVNALLNNRVKDTAIINHIYSEDIYTKIGLYKLKDRIELRVQHKKENHVQKIRFKPEQLMEIVELLLEFNLELIFDKNKTTTK